MNMLSEYPEIKLLIILERGGVEPGTSGFADLNTIHSAIRTIVESDPKLQNINKFYYFFG